MSTARWATAFSARARDHWTPARTAALADGKALLVPPAEGATLLRALGLLHRDASMPAPQVRKYFQIQHMVTLLGPALAALRARHSRLVLVDAGCGRSYLSMLLAWCGRHRWDQVIEIVGIDRNPDLIDDCRRRAALAGLDDVMTFIAGTVEDAGAHLAAAPHGVLSLHACDTATCDALALGVRLGAELIAVAPCCQAELARGWAAKAEAGDAGAFAPVWRAPHVRRELGAELTDVMRALLVRAAGYDVAAIEFVPSAHTRKNTLIRALRQGEAGGDPAARAEYEALVAATGGVGLALADRL
jgi:hypothetical protein